MSESVVPAYKAAYTILQENVLNPLLIDVTKYDETAVNQLVQNLTCAVQNFYNEVNKAINDSQKLRVEIDQKVVDVVAAVSAKEGEITGKQGEIQQKTIEIEGVQAQLNTAVQGLRDKQQGLANAENALRIAQEKVDKARNCLGGKRRRKRLIGKIFKPIRKIIDKVIEKPICSVVNSGGIDNAKDARHNAEQQLQSAQQQVNNVRQQLSSLQAQKSSLEAALKQLQTQLQELQSALSILNNVQNTTATINYDLKRVIDHISKIWDASSVLYTTIANLINFDLLISPLNEIYTELTKGNVLVNTSVNVISDATLTQVKQSLDQLANTLPQMPFSTLLTRADCFICLSILFNFYLHISASEIVSNNKDQSFLLSRDVFLPPDPALNPFYNSLTLPINNRNRRSTSNESTNIDSLFKQEMDEQILSQTGIDYPWQRFISAGPVAINILGQLIVLSTKIDFSFKDSVNDYKFKYIRHPQSYRATLIQISNDGWEAFNKAHSSMNTIQLYMAQIPKHVKTSFQILVQSSPRLLERLLIPSLNNIDRIGKECSKLASDTHDAFINVMQLLGEVIEITVLTQGVHMQKVQEVEMELNASRVAQQYQAQIIEKVQKQYNEAQEKIRQAQSAYTKALKDLPTGWEKILQNFAQAIVDLVDDIAPILVGAFVGGPAGAAAAGAASVGNSGSNTLPSLSNKIVSSQSMAVANMLSDQANSMLKTVTNNADGNIESLTKNFGSYKVGFNAMKKIMNTVKDDSELTKKVDSILQTVADVTNLKDASNITSLLTTSLEQLKPLVAAKSMNSTKVDAEDTIPQGGEQQKQSPSSSNVGNYDNEKFKVTVTLQRLQQAEQRSDALFQQMLEQENKMKDLMIKISQLDMTKINYEQIIDLLREAILLLGNIRVQWGQLVQFFSEISVRTQIAVKETLVPFVDRMKEVSSLDDITPSERLFYIDLLKGQAMDIHRQTFILYVMSRTYVDISNEFMMDKLSGLARMFGMQTDQERKQAVQKLLKDTEEAQEKVQALADKRKKTFEETISKRKNELETYLNQHGGKTQNDLDAINKGNQFLQLT
ncbi:hypothetical protein I4U23_004323 [Adineta vaga]|nr:hypothetical protein I4U23_004323 [Adineta vaga]